MRRQNATAASAAKAKTTHARKTHALSLFRIESSAPLLLGCVVAVASSLLLPLLPSCAAVGYSYTRFAGPVTGPEREVLVHDAFSGRPRVDYVAKPEYQFAYGVEDGKTRVLQNRKEERDGDAVTGVYSVVDPDGNLRVVKYTADNVNGFQAEVISNGIATLHGYNNNNNNNNINGNDNMRWYVQTGEPGQVQQVHHNTQPQQPQYNAEQQYVEPQQEAEPETDTVQEYESPNSSDTDEDEDDSDSRSDYDSSEDGSDGDERDYGSNEDSSREAANSDEDYY